MERAEASSLVGETVGDGRYAISGVLGEGAQGATLEAIDKRDGSLVAIKRFQVRGARSWKDVELAEREAEVLSSLSHPGLPAAVTHFEEEGALYLVMERIEGRALTLGKRTSRREVVELLADLDRILGYLHGLTPPVIHRDIKPQNLIRTDDPARRHVLVDFGSVRNRLEKAGGSTVVGTFGYMAPEQFQGRALPVSDVYAAGATALALLTGTEPENLPHRGLAIDVPAALGVSAKDPLAVALGQMLDPNPDTRAKAIGPLLAGLGGEAAGPGRDPRRAKAEPKRGGGSRRERRHQQRDERRAARREARAVAREARQMARHARRRGARSGELPPIVHLLWALARPFIVVMAAVARVAVSVATQVVVPTLFTLLSLLFGRGMREAGRTVSRAGRVADDGICWLRDFLLGRLPVDSEATGSSEAEGKARIDVADEEAGEGLRVDPRDATEEAAAELESALDEAAEELEAIVRRRRPPPDDPPGAS